MNSEKNRERFREPFRSCAYHRGIPSCCGVPYRCLYARDVKNLFLGGRLISLSHVAFSSARVMRTLGCLGEVAAMAAKVCMEQNVLPRGVYERHFDRLKEKMRLGSRFRHNSTVLRSADGNRTTSRNSAISGMTNGNSTTISANRPGRTSADCTRNICSGIRASETRRRIRKGGLRHPPDPAAYQRTAGASGERAANATFLLSAGACPAPAARL